MLNNYKHTPLIDLSNDVLLNPIKKGPDKSHHYQTLKFTGAGGENRTRTLARRTGF